MLSHNIIQKGEKINSLEIKGGKAEEINNTQNKKIDKIINDQKNLINFVFKPKCCEDDCINTNTPTGKCKNGNGFIEIINDTDIKYNKCIEGKGENKKVWLNAENKFYEPKNDFTTLSYYYEIKIKKEGMNNYSSFGFRNTKIYIVLGNNGFINYSPSLNDEMITFKIPSFSWNDGDIIGCGLVYPPAKMLGKHPYVFFTQDGNQIGKAVLLKEESYDYFDLYANLKCHSIEANFGNDLEAKPFCFDVYKHLFAEEFYN
uniref:Uncharacterized protein n=1 Tax=Meloidogyne enterolobii TaxID=390850 RepID=A0A6V7WBV0_MELEN|nr:unnamed protein product [Meloidogyne enterolobii]